MKEIGYSAGKATCSSEDYEGKDHDTRKGHAEHGEMRRSAAEVNNVNEGSGVKTDEITVNRSGLMTMRWKTRKKTHV